MSEGGRKNRAEYQRRVNRVIDHIQANRAEPLSLETLAGVAAFSPFHFHRIFKAVTGETVTEFVQRIRLEGAASALVLRPDRDILAIALDHGFNSASAFARAFKDRFGMSASQWRAGGCRQWRKNGQADRKPGQVDGNAGQEPGEAGTHDACRPSEGSADDQGDIMSPDITVTTLPSHLMAYFRHVGPYGAGGGIRDTWHRLRQWAMTRDLWHGDRTCLGIIYDDPTVTDPARCRYDAGIVVPEGFRPDEQANVVAVDGGKFASATFRGPPLQIGKAWQNLFVALTGSGFQPDHRPLTELYRGEAVDEKTGLVTCQICVPIKPL
jgi:AraC family transcriptional regulator